MLNDELEKIWQNSAKAEGIKFDKKELIKALNMQLNQFDRIIKNRNRREIVAAIIIILLSGTGFLFFTDILSRIGMALGVFYGVLVVYMLRNTKKQKPANYDLPIKDYLVEYRHYLIKERSLIVNVIYWYLLPPFIACLLFFIGQNLSITQIAYLMIFIFCLYTFIFFMNKAGAKKTLNPLIKKLDETIKDLERVE